MVFIRKPAVAGSFYPENKEDLIELIEVCFKEEEFGVGVLPKETERDFSKKIIGAIVPHAGYIYSGPCAARVYYEIYKNVPDNSTFIIIGPNHTGLGSNFSIISEGYFETPLGLVEIDSEVANELKRIDKTFEEDIEGHLEEHSIEVQLPFLQYIYGDKFKIVPITIKGLTFTEEIALELGYAFRELLESFKDKSIVMLISSDFTHYGPYYNYIPFGIGNKEKIKELVKKQDEEVFKYITNYKVKDFIDFVENKNPTICGYAGIAILLSTIKAMIKKNSNSIKAKKLCYYSSDDIRPSGGWNFVTYASFIFYRKNKKES